MSDFRTVDGEYLLDTPTVRVFVEEVRAAIAAASSPEAKRRIAAMTDTNDGFKIAEVDLSVRGPGDFFGTRQSGLPEFRVADLVRDAAMLEPARQEAFALIARDRELRAPEHGSLRAAVLARWRGKLDLASVG